MIQITDNAKHQLIDICTKEAMPFVRLGLQGGGCSGFMYNWDLTEEKEETDTEVLLGDKTLIIDPVTYGYLHDAEIDFVTEGFNSMFTINSPQVAGKCGCGMSVMF